MFRKTFIAILLLSSQLAHAEATTGWNDLRVQTDLKMYEPEEPSNFKFERKYEGFEDKIDPILVLCSDKNNAGLWVCAFEAELKRLRLEREAKEKK